MESKETMIHPSAHVEDGASLGAGCQIWHHVHIVRGARLGAGVVLGHSSFVGANVIVGAGSRIQNHVNLFEGVELGEEVFVGPRVTFTNVKRPRAFVSQRDRFLSTRVERGASIGAGATILPGLTLGEYSMVGAGALVTRDVEPYGLVYGQPARLRAHVSELGMTLIFDADGQAVCSGTGVRYQKDPVHGRVTRVSTA